MTLGARIKAVRGTLSQGDFAEAIGVSKSAVGSYERDAQAPGSAVIMAICERFQIEPRWLLFGSGPIRPETEATKNVPPEGNEYVTIPLVEARIGSDALLPATGTEGYCRLTRNFLSRRGDPKQMVMMRADGDSMEPAIRPRDMVLIDQGRRSPLPGGLFAVCIEDMVYIKMVDALPGRLILRSFNPSYPPIEFETRTAGESIRFVGKAIWLCRELL